MSTTLTIRNLSARIKQRLREQAARHQRSMEAEAREILRLNLEAPAPTPKLEEDQVAARRARIQAALGVWNRDASGVGAGTDEIMRELREDG